jgi:hypothetical protein
MNTNYNPDTIPPKSGAKRKTIGKRAVKTLAPVLLIAAGMIGASAGVAQADQRTGPDGTVTYYCVYAGQEYSVGAKVYLPDGSYQTCDSGGNWKRLATQGTGGFRPPQVNAPPLAPPENQPARPGVPPAATNPASTILF